MITDQSIGDPGCTYAHIPPGPAPAMFPVQDSHDSWITHEKRELYETKSSDSLKLPPIMRRLARPAQSVVDIANHLLPTLPRGPARPQGHIDKPDRERRRD